MQDVGSLLKNKINSIVDKKNSQQYLSNTYVNHEFQDFGLRIAHELNDSTHKALYIRYAKAVPRALLESSMAFVKLNYPDLPKKGKVFMWKLHSEIEEYKKKHPEFEIPRFKRKKRKRDSASSKNIPTLGTGNLRLL